MIRFKITAGLLAQIRFDLRRPHPFAHERVGFVCAGLCLTDSLCTLLAYDYMSVPDNEYLEDPSVGAMLGPDAMFNAMSWAHGAKRAVFHIHEHGGLGIPRFSGVDVREAKKFVPDFFKFRPELPHGTLVLSNDAAFGFTWLNQTSGPQRIDEFKVVGPKLSQWSVANA